MKKIKVLILIAFIFTIRVYASNTNPVVTEVAFSISDTTVTVNYKVADAEQSTVTIQMEVSSNSGTTWDFNYGTATGHIGTGISTGADLKTITWTYAGSYNANFKIRIIANDLVIDGGPCADATITYSGKTYNTVQIGTQCWLKENLNVGTEIAGALNQTNNSTIEKYCYSDLSSNCETYGGLYQWAEAVAYTNGASNTESPNPAFNGNVQGICPDGWHIPTYTELQTLKTAVSNNSNSLKKVGQGTGTNTSGFSALLAGYRYYTNGSFYYLAYYAYFWSSTGYDASSAGTMYLYYDFSNIYFNYDDKAYGFSVRCVKN